MFLLLLLPSILISLFILLFIMEGLYWPTIMFSFAFALGVMNKQTAVGNLLRSKRGI